MSDDEPGGIDEDRAIAAQTEPTDESGDQTGEELPPNEKPVDPADLSYVESQIIMTTVKVVAPFALTYGLFLMFHGADTPGGSFQGGAIIGATVLMIAFAFGIEPTRDWLRNRTVVALAAGGTAVFTIVGLIPIAGGDNFLAHPYFESTFGIDTKWGLETIEIGGVAPIVAGVVIGLFFVIAAGLGRIESDGAGTVDDGGPRPDGGTPRPPDEHCRVAEPQTDDAQHGTGETRVDAFGGEDQW